MSREILALNIVRLRTENGLSQRQLSTALNVSSSLLQHWEAQRCGLQTKHLVSLSNYFDISINALVRFPLWQSKQSISELRNLLL